MESVLGRYRNLIVLALALSLQVVGLAVQVKRTTDTQSTRLIRIWAVGAVTPLEKSIVWLRSSTYGLWHNYVFLRGVRQENRELKAEIERLRLERVRWAEDAQQARRLQSLLAFKEQYISKTVAAQVIGSSGSEQSRSVYIDKGSSAGIKPDMAVITADGVVGKVLTVIDGSTSQVLLVDDQSSGVGALLETSRLQGVLRGSPSGEVMLEKVMADEQVQPGERVVTSGGDRVFPKGLPVGTVSRVAPGQDLFLNIRVKPAANLSRLEEVLVVTEVQEKQGPPEEGGHLRASDILAQRLPSVPDKPADGEAAKNAAGGATAQPAVKPQNSTAHPPAAAPDRAPQSASTAAAGAAKPAGHPQAPPQSGATIKPAAPQPGATLKVSDSNARPPAQPAVAKPKPQPAGQPAPAAPDAPKPGDGGPH